MNVRAAGAALVAATVLGTGVAAHAAGTTHRAKIRKVTLHYTTGCGAVVDVDGNGVTGSPGACALSAEYQLTRKRTEKYLSIVVTDQTGRAVPGSLWLSSGAGTADSEAFCGALKNFPMTKSSYPMDLNSGVATSCPGEPTTGTIVVTYSNIPIK
jgi:hypothetical protein